MYRFSGVRSIWKMVKIHTIRRPHAPIRETTMLTLSTQVFCFTAARMPRGRASRMDTTAATSVSCTVYGKRAMISPVTEEPVV